MGVSHPDLAFGPTSGVNRRAYELSEELGQKDVLVARFATSLLQEQLYDVLIAPRFEQSTELID